MKRVRNLAVGLAASQTVLEWYSNRSPAADVKREKEKEIKMTSSKTRAIEKKERNR